MKTKQTTGEAQLCYFNKHLGAKLEQFSRRGARQDKLSIFFLAHNILLLFCNIVKLIVGFSFMFCNRFYKRVFTILEHIFVYVMCYMVIIFSYLLLSNMLKKFLRSKILLIFLISKLVTIY